MKVEFRKASRVAKRCASGGWFVLRGRVLRSFRGSFACYRFMLCEEQARVPVPLLVCLCLRHGWLSCVRPGGEPVGADVGRCFGKLANQSGGSEIVKMVEIS